MGRILERRRRRGRGCADLSASQKLAGRVVKGILVDG